ARDGLRRTLRPVEGPAPARGNAGTTGGVCRGTAADAVGAVEAATPVQAGAGRGYRRSYGTPRMVVVTDGSAVCSNRPRRPLRACPARPAAGARVAPARVPACRPGSVE